MPNTTYGTPYAQSSDLVSNWPGVSLNVADRIDDVSFKGNGLNDQTGTSYTLALTDAGKTVTLNNASAVTVTIPTNASVAYETGTCIYLTNKGAGLVTISSAGGVTLNNSSTLAQYASCYIQKLDTNTWVMVSGPAAGLTLVTSSSFSAVSSVSVNNCFTATYAMYRCMLQVVASASSVEFRIRLRASGSDNTANNYTYGSFRNNAWTTTTTTNNAGTALVSFWQIHPISGTGAAIPGAHSQFDICGPQATDYASIGGMGFYADNLSNNQTSGFYSGQMSVNTSYDGLTLFPASGTITGTLRIYGYRNS